MPVYEYLCPKCGVFETVQRITAPALRTCPIAIEVRNRIHPCGARVKRLISLTAGHVIEPNGVYQPIGGKDAQGKQREEKISPREYARRDNDLRKRMLATRDRAKKSGFTPVVNG